MTTERFSLVQRGLWLNHLSIGYHVVEAVVSVGAGLAAGSVALVGFGVDSAIEVAASGAAQWRLRADHDPARRERVERWTMRLIGASLLLLAVYVVTDSALSLRRHDAPKPSPVGVAVLALAVLVMPFLARAKRRVAVAMGSGALAADAVQASLCAWLSAIALMGVGLNAVVGWWWADPVAALAMVPIIATEGLEAMRGRSRCTDCGRPGAPDSPRRRSAL